VAIPYYALLSSSDTGVNSGIEAHKSDYLIEIPASHKTCVFHAKVKS
jgi:hypothetical protein